LLAAARGAERPRCLSPPVRFAGPRSPRVIHPRHEQARRLSWRFRYAKGRSGKGRRLCGGAGARCPSTPPRRSHTAYATNSPVLCISRAISVQSDPAAAVGLPATRCRTSSRSSKGRTKWAARHRPYPARKHRPRRGQRGPSPPCSPTAQHAGPPRLEDCRSTDHGAGNRGGAAAPIPSRPLAPPPTRWAELDRPGGKAARRRRRQPLIYGRPAARWMRAPRCWPLASGLPGRRSDPTPAARGSSSDRHYLGRNLLAGPHQLWRGRRMSRARGSARASNQPADPLGPRKCRHQGDPPIDLDPSRSPAKSPAGRSAIPSQIAKAALGPRARPGARPRMKRPSRQGSLDELKGEDPRARLRKRPPRARNASTPRRDPAPSLGRMRHLCRGSDPGRLFPAAPSASPV